MCAHVGQSGINNEEVGEVAVTEKCVTKCVLT